MESEFRFTGKAVQIPSNSPEQPVVTSNHTRTTFSLLPLTANQLADCVTRKPFTVRPCNAKQF